MPDLPILSLGKFAMALVSLLLFVHLSVTELETRAVGRPRLVRNSLRFLNQTVLNIVHELAIAELEFDQDLYATLPFLCGHADQECDPQPANCVPCDWTGSVEVGGLSCERSITLFGFAILNQFLPLHFSFKYLATPPLTPSPTLTISHTLP